VTLGEQLVAARKRAGLTLDELSERTRIRPGLLEAMEAGDFARCGGNFYARGHLRAIAKVLDADAGALVAEFDRHHAAPEVTPSRRQERADARPPAVHSARPRWAVVMGAILVGLMGWGMVRLFTLPNDVEATATPSTPATPSVTVTRVTTAVPKPVARPSKRPKPKPTSVRLTVVADHGGTYLLLRNFNGEYLFSGSLTRGVQQSLAYKGMILVTVDVPKNARYYINGKQVFPKERRFNVLLDGTFKKR
jgi:cytoskeleton protein RodZ